MKLRLPFSFVILGMLAWGCSRHGGDAPAKDAPPAAAAAEPESRVRHGTNGEVIVTLDAVTQKTMGLQTSSLAAMQLRPEVKGYGKVLDPAPLAALITELAGARAQNEASQAELKRVKTLAAQDNASQRVLQTAEAAAARDATLLGSVQLRLLSGWGEAIAKKEDLAAFVQGLVSLENALVQVNVSAEQATNIPSAARIVMLGQESTPIEAKFLAQATAVDPQVQGRGFLFLVTNNASRLLPGASVTGFLEMPGELLSGVVVPREALVRFNGTTWVYLQTGDDTFQRTMVALEQPVAEGWFVGHGLGAGQKVVTVGAQELLSEELKGSAE